jgi:hypothetical protein
MKTDPKFLGFEIQERRRRLYLEGLSADYAVLRKDAKASADLDKENEIWDRTDSEGLDLT